MEDQNLNLPAAMSPSSTHDGSETNNNNNPVTTEVARVVDVGLDTGAQSEPVGSNFPPVKRGRGRPRKVRENQPSPVPVTPVPELVIQPFGSEEKRGRGRPRGTGKLQILASIGGFVAETAGGSITPHVLTVNPGEDVVAKIFTFFQNAPRVATCVLSAAGTVSSVVLRQPNVSGGFLRYEGQFDILSLRGSCTFTTGAAAGGTQRKISMLSVSLSKSDGRIFGGVIENSMIAATPIPLIMATFKQNISSQIKRKCSSPPSTAPNMLPNLKVPKLTVEQGEPSYQTGNATANSNGVAVADMNVVAAETTNAVSVSENVTTYADENVHSDSVGGGGGLGIDLESQEPETDHKTSP
ncbi:unnamed protein product [Trifolium pratense]|uniref:Uncharacterized protein n=1 Tax=Trifolium pratense TaxID=57577 RepID=A0ACB0KE29_TRIPR|nr:unnamed protein product [Trifolium pratense]